MDVPAVDPEPIHVRAANPIGSTTAQPSISPLYVRISATKQAALSSALGQRDAVQGNSRPSTHTRQLGVSSTHCTRGSRCKKKLSPLSVGVRAHCASAWQSRPNPRSAALSIICCTHRKPTEPPPKLTFASQNGPYRLLQNGVESKPAGSSRTEVPHTFVHGLARHETPEKACALGTLCGLEKHPPNAYMALQPLHSTTS